ncbi:MAG TPA: GNAT family N-acetyltransferase [Clostridia bacterium]|nr:GNAT family N-acetyltransferase [Clostridia bacterium]
MERTASEKDLTIRELKAEECTSYLLKHFNRYQDVKRCWRKENGKWALKDIAFVEQWDDKEKSEHVASLIWCIEHGGAAFGAFANGFVIGFACVGRELSGSKREYAHLGMLHVSYECRNKGIGKKLFSAACDKARGFGAKKLYISAHSSEESQAFYKAVDCVEAEEADPAAVEKEPCDCQLEFVL